MIYLDRALVAHAAEALMIAARDGVDRNGLRLWVELPRTYTETSTKHQGAPTPLYLVDLDTTRIQAIVLGALVGLCNGPVAFADERDASLTNSERAA